MHSMLNAIMTGMAHFVKVNKTNYVCNHAATQRPWYVHSASQFRCFLLNYSEVFCAFCGSSGMATQVMLMRVVKHCDEIFKLCPAYPCGPQRACVRMFVVVKRRAGACVCTHAFVCMYDGTADVRIRLTTFISIHTYSLVCWYINRHWNMHACMYTWPGQSAVRPASAHNQSQHS